MGTKSVQFQTEGVRNNIKMAQAQLDSIVLPETQFQQLQDVVQYRQVIENELNSQLANNQILRKQLERRQTERDRAIASVQQAKNRQFSQFEQRITDFVSFFEGGTRSVGQAQQTFRRTFRVDRVKQPSYPQNYTQLYRNYMAEIQASKYPWPFKEHTIKDNKPITIAVRDQAQLEAAIAEKEKAVKQLKQAVQAQRAQNDKFSKMVEQESTNASRRLSSLNQIK